MPTPRDLQPELSAMLSEAVIRGMAVEPQHRPDGIYNWLRLLPTAEVTHPSAAAMSSTSGMAAVPLAPAHYSSIAQVASTKARTVAVASLAQNTGFRYGWMFGLTALAVVAAVALRAPLWRSPISPSTSTEPTEPATSPSASSPERSPAPLDEVEQPTPEATSLPASDSAAPVPELSEPGADDSGVPTEPETVPNEPEQLLEDPEATNREAEVQRREEEKEREKARREQERIREAQHREEERAREAAQREAERGRNNRGRGNGRN